VTSSHLANKSFEAPKMSGPSPKLIEAHPLLSHNHGADIARRLKGICAPGDRHELSKVRPAKTVKGKGLN
jgi:hypothetical protein